MIMCTYVTIIPNLNFYLICPVREITPVILGSVLTLFSFLKPIYALVILRSVLNLIFSFLNFFKTYLCIGNLLLFLQNLFMHWSFWDLS